MDQPPPPVTAAIASGAGFGIRALARILDIVLANVFGLVVGIFIGITFAILQLLGVISDDWMEKIQGIDVVGFVLSILGAFGYHVLCEGIHGSTLGKLICKLQVLNRDGMPCDLKGSFIRGLAWHLDGLIFGLIGYISMQKSPLNQRYGDVWAKTVVVKAQDIPLEQRSLWCQGRVCR